MPRKTISILLIAAQMVTSAQAVTLSDVQGIVSADRGKGFQHVAIGAQLGPGDRIRTGEGSVSVVYENGCASRVGPNQLVVVPSSPPPCQALGPAYRPEADGELSVNEIINNVFVVGAVIALVVAIAVAAGHQSGSGR